MTENLVKYNNELSKKDIDLLVSTSIIPKGTPNDVINLFGKVCQEKGLSPFSKQIHLIPRAGKYTFQTSIDGYRSIAERTGVYAGNDDYKFDGNNTEFDLISNKILKPTTATATVYKIVGGLRCPFSATARWDEYYPGKQLGFMWEKMPFLMLGKCAEALALRKAFPEALGGLYTDEEMRQADKTVEVAEIIQDRNYTAEANECKTIDELSKWFSSLTPDEKKKYKALATNRKEELTPKEDLGLLLKKTVELDNAVDNIPDLGVQAMYKSDINTAKDTSKYDINFIETMLKKIKK
jgi:phage recombination protein Bet